MNTTDALQRVIDNVGAFEVAPGRYAFTYALTWYVGSAEALLNLCEYFDSKGSLDTVCLQRWAKKEPGACAMRLWWTPEKQYGGKDAAGRRVRVTYSTLAEAQHFWPSIIVTADLETGEEVPA